MDFSFPLSNKVALVTGAASGIGAAIADAFSGKGVRLALCDLDAAKAAASAERLGGGARAFGCNVAESADVAKTVEAVIAAFGRIDLLVNCAGIVDLAPAEEISVKAWQRTLDINLTGSFLMAQAVGKRMIAQGGGKIVNIASQAGSVAIEGHVAYCASKFAVIGMTKTLALEWGRHGICINSVSPTVVMTELGKKAWEGANGEAMKKQIPNGRFAEPEEIAAAVVFLASPGADMINGADLLVDGGYTVDDPSPGERCERSEWDISRRSLANCWTKPHTSVQEEIDATFPPPENVPATGRLFRDRERPRPCRSTAGCAEAEMSSNANLR